MVYKLTDRYTFQGLGYDKRYYALSHICLTTNQVRTKNMLLYAL